MISSERSAEQKKEKAHHEDGPCGIGRVSSRRIEFTSQTGNFRGCTVIYDGCVGIREGEGGMKYKKINVNGIQIFYRVR